MSDLAVNDPATLAEAGRMIRVALDRRAELPLEIDCEDDEKERHHGADISKRM